MKESTQPLITILGPTASGKTELACQLAHVIDGEIISADSRQVYKYMDIGTGKDLDEYVVDDKKIPYHLIDIKEPGYQYNIWEYQKDFLQAFNLIQSNNKWPILCGGSGLYLETALSGNTFLGIPSNPKLRDQLSALTEAERMNLWNEIPTKYRQKLDSNTDKRQIRSLEIWDFIQNHPEWEEPVYPQMNHFIFGVDIDRDLRRDKITKRLSYRLNHGLIEEVENLLKMGLSHEQLQYYGLEYKWVSRYLLGEISKKELFEGLNTAIHQFSKRQMTWFRRMEKQGYNIEWVKADQTMDLKLNQLLCRLNA